MNQFEVERAERDFAERQRLPLTPPADAARAYRRYQQAVKVSTADRSRSCAGCVVLATLLFYAFVALCQWLGRGW